MSNNPPRCAEIEEQEFSAVYQGLKLKVITSFRTHDKTVVLIEDA